MRNCKVRRNTFGNTKIYIDIMLLSETHTRFCMSVKLGWIFEPKRDEVTGGWRKLHNEELRNFHSSPSSIIRMIKSRRIRRAGHVAQMGKKRNAYRFLVGKPEGKRSLGRPRH
jgi:hypothetical protein